MFAAVSSASRRALGVIASGALAVTVGVVSCAPSGDNTNSAFVFIKPHANTRAAQELVSKTLKEKGCTIVAEGEIKAEVIDKDMLIDQHYYAIASKATLLKPSAMPVPADKFEKAFGLPWSKALADGVVYNALDACKVLGVDAAGLDALWATAKKAKFGGGFYCGLIEKDGKKVYVMNGFFSESCGVSGACCAVQQGKSPEGVHTIAVISHTAPPHILSPQWRCARSSRSRARRFTTT